MDVEIKFNSSSKDDKLLMRTKESSCLRRKILS